MCWPISHTTQVTCWNTFICLKSRCLRKGCLLCSSRWVVLFLAPWGKQTSKQVSVRGKENKKDNQTKRRHAESRLETKGVGWRVWGRQTTKEKPSNYWNLLLTHTHARAQAQWPHWNFFKQHTALSPPTCFSPTAADFILIFLFSVISTCLSINAGSI